MVAMTGSFDAQQFQPRQGGEAHPIGIYDFQITNTEITPTKDQSGGMFVVEFTTPSGRISNRYNLWNNSAKAVEIAHGQLSALCHATGVFKLDWQNEGNALRGARGKLEVVMQKDSNYVEVKRVFDINGNEPGKTGAAAQPNLQPQQQPPQPSQPQQQWTQPNQQQPPMMPNNAGGWQQPNQPQQPIQQQPTAPAAPQGWSQQPQQTNNTGTQQPPWANR